MRAALNDEIISDGTRFVGGVNVKASSFVPYLADGTTLPSCKSIAEARAAVHAADVDQRDLHRLVRDGGRAP